MHTTNELADRSGMSIADVYKFVQLGLIKSQRKMGRNYVWTDADLQKVISLRDDILQTKIDLQKGWHAEKSVV